MDPKKKYLLWSICVDSQEATRPLDSRLYCTWTIKNLLSIQVTWNWLTIVILDFKNLVYKLRIFQKNHSWSWIGLSFKKKMVKLSYNPAIYLATKIGITAISSLCNLYCNITRCISSNPILEGRNVINKLCKLAEVKYSGFQVTLTLRATNWGIFWQDKARNCTSLDQRKCQHKSLFITKWPENRRG